jgi:hypothetical protein
LRNCCTPAPSSVAWRGHSCGYGSSI